MTEGVKEKKREGGKTQLKSAQDIDTESQNPHRHFAV